MKKIKQLRTTNAKKLNKVAGGGQENLFSNGKKHSQYIINPQHYFYPSKQSATYLNSLHLSKPKDSHLAFLEA